MSGDIIASVLVLLGSSWCNREDPGRDRLDSVEGTNGQCTVLVNTNVSRYAVYRGCCSPHYVGDEYNICKLEFVNTVGVI